jgi:hypothetical protein
MLTLSGFQAVAGSRSFLWVAWARATRARKNDGDGRRSANDANTARAGIAANGAEGPLWVEPARSGREREGRNGASRPFRGSLPQPVEADLELRWKGSASEMAMTSENSIPTRQRAPWNSGRLVGQKRPLKPKDVWTIRVRLQTEGRRRYLAMFNLAIDSKLRGCDLVPLRIDDVFARGIVRDRAIVIQKKTGRPVQFELTEQTRAAVDEWLAALDARKGRYLFPSRLRGKPHLSTRQ